MTSGKLNMMWRINNVPLKETMKRYTIKLMKDEVEELMAIINKGSHSSHTFRTAYILLNLLIDHIYSYSKWKLFSDNKCVIIILSFVNTDKQVNFCSNPRWNYWLNPKLRFLLWGNSI